MKFELYIRVDGSHEIGMGHIVRTLVLADLLKDLYTITFICRYNSDKIKKNIHDAGFRLINIQTENDWVEGLNNQKIVILDGYNFNIELRSNIKNKGCILICIDDDKTNFQLADIIINQSPMSNIEMYPHYKAEQLLLGAKYSLLRNEFTEAAQKPISIKKENTLTICMGGSDFYNLTYTLVKSLNDLDIRLQVNVILGAFVSKSMRSNVLNFKSNHNMLIEENINAEKMSQILLQSKYIIAPSSSILMEAVCCSCNILTCYYADNQKAFHEYVTVNQIAKSIGNISQNFDSQDFINSFKIFMKDELITDQYLNYRNLLSQSKTSLHSFFRTLN